MIGRFIDCNIRYVEAWSNPQKMMQFYNVMNLPLIKMDKDREVLDAVPIPELHSLMGTVNHLLELKRKYRSGLGKEEMLWDWCSSKGVSRRGVMAFSF